MRTITEHFFPNASQKCNVWKWQKELRILAGGGNKPFENEL
jgi:hypothetical protein